MSTLPTTVDQSTIAGSKLHYEAIRTIDNETYLLSSSSARLDHTAINAALASPELFWASSLSSEHLSTMLENSFCLGLYVLDANDADINAELAMNSNVVPSPEDRPGHQIGFARLITDHVTFAWLTDVYVLPAYQRRGLGRWMISALNVILSGMPELRRAMLIAHVGRESAEYQKIMGCEVWENGTSIICMQKRGPAGGTLGTKSDATNE